MAIWTYRNIWKIFASRYGIRHATILILKTVGLYVEANYYCVCVLPYISGMTNDDWCRVPLGTIMFVMILISNMISLYSESKCSFYHTLWVWPMMIGVWHHLTSSCGTGWEPKYVSSVLIFQQYLSCDWKYIRKGDINFENREFLILLPLKLKGRQYID